MFSVPVVFCRECARSSVPPTTATAAGTRQRSWKWMKRSPNRSARPCMTTATCEFRVSERRERRDAVHAPCRRVIYFACWWYIHTCETRETRQVDTFIRSIDLVVLVYVGILIHIHIHVHTTDCFRSSLLPFFVWSKPPEPQSLLEPSASGVASLVTPTSRLNNISLSR